MLLTLSLFMCNKQTVSYFYMNEDPDKYIKAGTHQADSRKSGNICSLHSEGYRSTQTIATDFHLFIHMQHLSLSAIILDNVSLSILTSE